MVTSEARRTGSWARARRAPRRCAPLARWITESARAWAEAPFPGFHARVPPAVLSTDRSVRLVAVVVVVSSSVLAFAGCGKGTGGASSGAVEADAGGHASPRSLTPEQAQKPLAKVGSATITLGDYAAALENMDQFDQLRYQSTERRKELLEEMITVELLSQEAVARGWDKDPLAQQELRAISRVADARRGAQPAHPERRARGRGPRILRVPQGGTTRDRSAVASPRSCCGTRPPRAPRSRRRRRRRPPPRGRARPGEAVDRPPGARERAGRPRGRPRDRVAAGRCARRESPRSRRGPRCRLRD